MRLIEMWRVGFVNPNEALEATYNNLIWADIDKGIFIISQTFRDHTMPVWAVVNVGDTERAEIVKFFVATDCGPQVSCFEQRHDNFYEDRRHTSPAITF